MDRNIVLTGNDRDDILKAVKIIERHLKQIDQEPRWKALYVIQTNLTIIQARLTNLPRATPN